MWKLRHLYARLAKGQDGKAAVAAAGATGIAAAALIAGAVIPEARALSFGLALFLILALQVLSIYLTGRLRARTNDVHYAVALENGLQRAGFALPQLFYEGAAGTPSLQLYSLKILLFCRPERVLELGSGQTTRVLSAYARSNDKARVVTLEQSAAWASKFSGEVAHDRHQYIHAPLEHRAHVCTGTGVKFEADWYRDVPVHVLEQRYDYVLVDGPDDSRLGSEFSPYARAGILWHTPALLAERFVVLFDDADMYKHEMSIDIFKKELAALKIPFVSFRVHGIKDQEIVCSPEWGFLRSV